MGRTTLTVLTLIVALCVMCVQHRALADDLVPYQEESVNLRWIEARRFVRSKPMISPDGKMVTYSEITFMPHTRQAFSRLFLVPVTSIKLRPEQETAEQLKPNAEALEPFIRGSAEDDPFEGPQVSEAVAETWYQRVVQRVKRPFQRSPKMVNAIERMKNKSPLMKKRKTKSGQSNTAVMEDLPSLNPYDPEKTQKKRVLLYAVGSQHSEAHAFHTLEPVDWSANSQKLLFSRKNGRLHEGLRVSDVLIYDRKKSTDELRGSGLYRELLDAVEYYWLPKDIHGDLPRGHWDVEPLGWVLGSDKTFLYHAWAYQFGQAPMFLGLWQYNTELARATLLDEKQPKRKHELNSLQVK